MNGVRQESRAKRRVPVNAESRATTRSYRIFPGYDQKHLPAAAQAVVEQALLDDDLANARADDERWTQLYDELKELIHRPHDVPAQQTHTNSSRSSSSKSSNIHQDEVQYEWGSSGEDEASSEAVDSCAFNDETRAAQEAYAREVLPKRDLAAAVHRAVFHSLKDQGKAKGKAKAKAAEGGAEARAWDASSLVALTVLCEEIALSQAAFSARRSMFAKQASKASKKKQRRQQQKQQEQEQAEEASAM